MKIAEEIGSIYNDIGSRLSKIPEISCKRNNIVKTSGSFTITLELIVKSRISEDDYGIVFSTNCQTESHEPDKGNIKNNRMYLVSDVMHGNGKLIDSTEELTYSSSDAHSQEIALRIIISFISRLQKQLGTLLNENYGILIKE